MYLIKAISLDFCSTRKVNQRLRRKFLVSFTVIYTYTSRDLIISLIDSRNNMHRSALVALATVAVAYAQQAGTQTAEVHPPLNWQTCSASGTCTNVNGKVVLDANWRWLHTTS